MNLLSLFKRGPSMKERAEARLLEWQQDRAGAVAAMKLTEDSYQFATDEWRLARSAETMLRFRETETRIEAHLAESERIENIRENALKSSRFTVLRMKRGFPFKLRRQPV